MWNLLRIRDCRSFSVLKTLTGYRSYSHSVLNSLARSWYLSIVSFSFSSIPAFPGTAASMIWQTACCLSTTTRSGLLCSSWWLVWVAKSQRILTVSDSRTFPGPCSYHLSATSSPYFLHRHQWPAVAKPSRLPLNSQWANAEHTQTMWLTQILPYSCATSCILSWQPLCRSFPLLQWFAVPGPGSLLTILQSTSWIPPSSTTSKRDCLSQPPTVLKTDHVMVFPSSPPLSHHSSVAYGDRESPWKIPRLVRISPSDSFP